MNIDQTTVHGTQGFNMENLTDEKGKYHGRQPANLHYTWECATHSCGGLQEVYIAV
jgi:hypothetical protein